MATDTQTTIVHKYTTYIRATPEAIWEALTQPEWTVRYGYAPLLNYEFRAGGKFEAYPNEGMKQFPGIPDVIIDGEVLDVVKPYRLEQTWRMLMDEHTATEGFTHLTTEITPIRSGVTRLTITHDLTGAPRLAAMVDGDLEPLGAGGGWNEILSGLKTLLETGEQLPFLSGPEQDCPVRGRLSGDLDIAIQWTQMSAESLLTALRSTPEDKLTWTPAATSKTVLQVIGHVAYVNNSLALSLLHPEGPAPSFDEVLKLSKLEEDKVTSRAQAEQLITTSTETVVNALQSLSQEVLEGQVITPFGPRPTVRWIRIPSLHMDSHKAQIDYLQTIWGDTLIH